MSQRSLGAKSVRRSLTHSCAIPNNIGSVDTHSPETYRPESAYQNFIWMTGSAMGNPPKSQALHALLIPRPFSQLRLQCCRIIFSEGLLIMAGMLLIAPQPNKQARCCFLPIGKLLTWLSVMIIVRGTSVWVWDGPSTEWTLIRVHLATAGASLLTREACSAAKGTQEEKKLWVPDVVTLYPPGGPLSIWKEGEMAPHVGSACWLRKLCGTIHSMGRSYAMTAPIVCSFVLQVMEDGSLWSILPFPCK